MQICIHKDSVLSIRVCCAVMSNHLFQLTDTLVHPALNKLTLNGTVIGYCYDCGEKIEFISVASKGEEDG